MIIIIITHPHPSHHLLFLVSPPCQVEVESVIQQNWSMIMTILWSSDAEDIDTEN